MNKENYNKMPNMKSDLNEISNKYSTQRFSSKLTNKEYKKDTKHVDNYKSLTKITIYDFPKEMDSKIAHEPAQEQTTSGIKKNYYENTHESQKGPPKTILPERMNSDNFERTQKHTSHKSRPNLKKESKHSSSSSKKPVNKKQVHIDKVESECSEPSSARNRLSAYFQSFIPKPILESSESFIKTKTNSKIKKDNSSLISSSLSKCNRNTTLTPEDSKIALRVKYIEWLLNENMFFNVGSVDEPENPQQKYIRYESCIPEVDGTDSNVEEALTNRKRKRHSIKPHRKFNKNSTAVEKISSSTHYTTPNDVISNYDDVEKGTQIKNSQHMNVRVYTSVENIKQVNSNEYVKKAISLCKVNISKPIISNANIILTCIPVCEDEPENSNNDNNTNETLINLHESNYTQCNEDYNRNVVTSKLCSQCKESFTLSVNNTIQLPISEKKCNCIDAPDINVNSRADNSTNHSQLINNYPDSNTFVVLYTNNPQKFSNCFSYNEHEEKENEPTTLYSNSISTKPLNVYLTNSKGFFQNPELNKIYEANQQHNHKLNYIQIPKIPNYNGSEYGNSEELCNVEGNQNDCGSTEASSKQNLPNDYIDAHHHDNFNALYESLGSRDQILPMELTNCSVKNNLLRHTQHQSLNKTAFDLYGLQDSIGNIQHFDNVDVPSSYQIQHEYVNKCVLKSHKVNQQVSSVIHDNLNGLTDTLQMSSSSNYLKHKDNISHFYDRPSLTGFETTDNTNAHNIIHLTKTSKVALNNMDNALSNPKEYCHSDLCGNENIKQTYFQCGTSCTELTSTNKTNIPTKHIQLTAVQCSDETCNTLTGEIKNGRKRKYEIKDDNQSEDYLMDEEKVPNSLLSHFSKEDESMSKHEGTTEILYVMSELQDKVNLLQSQISCMNTSCTKFENIENLLMVLKSDVANGLKQFENKLKHIGSDSKNCYEDEISYSKTAWLNKIKVSNCNTSNNHFQRIDRNETPSNRSLETKRNYLQSSKDIGLMTEEDTEIKNNCANLNLNKSSDAFDKGIQCKINELHQRNQTADIPLLAVTENNIVLTQHQFRSNKLNETNSSNKNTSNSKLKKYGVKKKLMLYHKTENMECTKSKGCVIL